MIWSLSRTLMVFQDKATCTVQTEYGKMVMCVCVCLFQCNYRKNVKGHSLAFIVTSEFCSFWEVSSEPNEPHVFSLQAICAVCVTTSFLRCGIKFSRRDPSYWKYSFTVHLSPCLRSHLIPQHFCAGTGVLDALSLISLKPPSGEQQGAGFRSVRAYVWPGHECWQKWCLGTCWTWAEGQSLSVEADWSPKSPSVPGGKEEGDELPATKIRKEEGWWLIPSAAANIHLLFSVLCPVLPQQCCLWGSFAQYF